LSAAKILRLMMRKRHDHHPIPRWEDALAEGDFIAAEHDLFHEELRSGIWLEENYLVTSTGVQLLTDWPQGL
jgi:hypothetical protein